MTAPFKKVQPSTDLMDVSNKHLDEFWYFLRVELFHTSEVKTEPERCP